MLLLDFKDGMFVINALLRERSTIQDCIYPDCIYQ